jgi:hypothetical protein
MYLWFIPLVYTFGLFLWFIPLVYTFGVCLISKLASSRADTPYPPPPILS